MREEAHGWAPLLTVVAPDLGPHHVGLAVNRDQRHVDLVWSADERGHLAVRQAVREDAAAWELGELLDNALDDQQRRLGEDDGVRGDGHRPPTSGRRRRRPCRRQPASTSTT